MITPSFNLTATERVLPRLALDFTTASLDSRVTFTRTGNTATVVNSSGLVAPINANLPRFDFDPVTLACKGLLIEEGRANTFTYSDNFGNAAWVTSILNVTVNAATSPDGTTNADKLIPTTANGGHLIKQAQALTNGVAYSMSGFFKADGYRRVMLRESTFNGNAAVFDLISGTVISTTSATAAITNFGNGWYRCEMRLTPTWTGSSDMAFFVMPDNGTSFATSGFAGDGTSGILAYGAQFEAGAFATSYIPTVATAVTRNADVASMTGTNFSSWYNGAGGVFTAKFIPMSINTANRIIVGTNNYAMYIQTSARLVIFDGANSASSSNLMTVNTEAHAATGFGADKKLRSSLNGTATVASAAYNGTFASASSLSIATSACVWMKSLEFYPQELLNAEMQAFSK